MHQHHYRQPNYQVGFTWFGVTFLVFGIAALTWSVLALLALPTTVLGCYYTMPPEI